MGNIKQINIKNRTYYFFNGMILKTFKDFNSSLIKMTKSPRKMLASIILVTSQ